MKTENFIKKINEIKNDNQLDLAIGEDLSIALMNLISLEEHFLFSFIKTSEDKYLEYLEQTRELRKKLLARIVKKDDNSEKWCIPPGTIIVSNFSSKKIENLRTGDLVLTHRGRFMPIKKLFKRSYKGKLIKIIPNYTNIPLLLTPEHPVLCATKVRIKQKTLWRKKFVTPKILWKNAEELTSSDFLLFPRHNDSSKIQKLKVSYSWTNKGTFKPHAKFKQEKKLIITNELLELIGLYIAEGCISRGKYYFKKEKRFMNNSYISWTFSIKERKLVEKVAQYLKAIFNISPGINERLDKNIIEITSGKRLLIKFFEQFGTKSNNKVLSDWVIHLPKEKFPYLLKGLIEGDGSISKFNVSYATCSEHLAYQLRIMLFKHGILHNLSKRILKNGKIGNRAIKAHYPMYNISISGDSARKFCKYTNINYYGGEKTSGNFGYVLDKFIMIPIRKITEQDYKGIVLNFSILSDESYTTINGVVHNCISKHLLATSMRLSEVGTKYLHNGNKKEAEELFYDAFNIYSLFWAINGSADVKKEININETKLSKISQIMKKILDCCKE